jgi:hypothetical protein
MSFYVNNTSLNTANFNNLPVSSVYYNNTLVWGEATILPTGYLEFNSYEPFNIFVNYPNWEGSIEYSFNTITWNEWDGRSIKAEYDFNSTKYVLYMRGSNNKRLTGTASSYAANFNADYCWSIIGSNVSCIGNIETLLDYQAVQRLEHPPMYTCCFSAMFYGCSALIKPPELLAVQLASYCYDSMFMYCSNLLNAPELPSKSFASGLAGALFNYCYQNMFLGCTSLIEAPELPSTVLSEGCYSAMFKGCTSLTKAPKLSAKTVRNESYAGMFYGCTNLIEIPMLPFNVYLMGRACANMFRDCVSLKFSTNQSEDYPNAYYIYGTDETPGGWTGEIGVVDNMFTGTGGSFTGTPKLKTIYYTNATVV